MDQALNQDTTEGWLSCAELAEELWEKPRTNTRTAPGVVIPDEELPY